MYNYIIFGKYIFMEKLITFSINDLAKITNHRSGEIKFGEKMLTFRTELEVISEH